MTDHLTDDEIDSIAHGIHECAGLILDDIQIGMLDDLIAEVRRLRAAIAAADLIHMPLTIRDTDIPATICDFCSQYWPCDTHRALHPEADQ